MNDHQKPLDSGFNAVSTASDVLSGLDLKGRFAVVTGGHSGLGLETTKALSAAGAAVLVAARNQEAAKAAISTIPDVEVEVLDLSDLSSVRGFAERVRASGRHIDMLINNAGIMACPEIRVGPARFTFRPSSTASMAWSSAGQWERIPMPSWSTQCWTQLLRR